MVQYINCGDHVDLPVNTWFECYDYIEDVWLACITIGNGQSWDYYQCWSAEDGWEHANWNENDGTPDNSLLTSIETDGILETSPSLVVKTYETESSLEETSEVASMPPNVKNYYCGTQIYLPAG